MKDKARKPTTTPGSEPPPAEGVELPERWSVQRKTELVLRLLRGEALDAVSRESQVPAHELESWKRLFLEQGTWGLKTRSDPEERELTLAPIQHWASFVLAPHDHFLCICSRAVRLRKLALRTSEHVVQVPRRVCHRDEPDPKARLLQRRYCQTRELSRSLLNLAERDGRASYPQFTARRRVPT